MLSQRIQDLDIIAENRLLTMTEWEERISLDDQIDEIYKLDEIMWIQ